jgi:hypothetical protein
MSLRDSIHLNYRITRPSWRVLHFWVFFASPRKLTNQRDASRRVTANLGLIRLIREEAFGRRATPQRRSLSILVVEAETQGFSILHWLFRDEVAKAINEMQAALGVKHAVRLDKRLQMRGALRGQTRIPLHRSRTGNRRDRSRIPRSGRCD